MAIPAPSFELRWHRTNRPEPCSECGATVIGRYWVRWYDLPAGPTSDAFEALCDDCAKAAAELDPPESLEEEL